MRHHRIPSLGLALGLLVAAQSLAAQDELERCPAPIGTLAVIEPDAEILTSLNNYGLGSPTALIRMMVQQSGCFRVVERGVGMTAMQRERDLARQGDLQRDADIGAGQMVAADYLLTAHVQFSDDDAGGVGGAVGALARRHRRIAGVGGVLAGLKFKEAQTSMLIGDTRTGIQVAAAEGHARRTDFRLAAIGWSGPTAGAIGAYTNTNEGKVVAASFLDNYNALVRAVRSDPSLVVEARRVQIAALVADAAGGELTINAGAADGVMAGETYDVLRPGREIRDPQTGRLIRRATTPVGAVQITEVGDGWSVGIPSGGPAQVGDCVDTCPVDEPRGPEEAAAPAPAPAMAEAEAPPAVEPARPIGPFTWTPYQFHGTERFRYVVLREGVSRSYTIELLPGPFDGTVNFSVESRLGEETRTNSTAVALSELADLRSIYVRLGLGEIAMALFVVPWWNGVPREWTPGQDQHNGFLFRVENGCEHAGQRGALGRVYHMGSNVLTACVSPDVPMPLAVRAFLSGWIDVRLVEYRP